MSLKNKVLIHYNKSVDVNPECILMSDVLAAVEEMHIYFCVTGDRKALDKLSEVFGK